MTTLKEYYQFLQDASGWTRSVAAKCPQGTKRYPSILLEVNPQFPRPIFKEISKSRNLMTVALGGSNETSGFDKVIDDIDISNHVSGINDDIMNCLPEEARLGSVVIAHQSEFMEADNIAELLVSAVERVGEGGKVYLVDKPERYEKNDLPLLCIKPVQERFGKKEVLIKRDLITPTVTSGFDKKHQYSSNHVLIEEIMRLVRAGDSKAKLTMIEDRNIKKGEPMKVAESKQLEGRISLPVFGEEVISIMKLTKEQIKMRKKMSA